MRIKCGTILAAVCAEVAAASPLSAVTLAAGKTEVVLGEKPTRVAQFAGRTLVGGAEYYMWSPYTKGVDQLENFGTFDFEQPSDARRPRKFSRVWTFTRLRDEEFARKIAALNVQNVGGVDTPEKLAIAKKYGFHIYVLVIGAGGPHKQVMLPEEDAIVEWYRGPQPPSGMSKAELRRWTVDQQAARMNRLLSVGYSDGGEPSPGREKSEVLGWCNVDCLVGPVARSNSVEKALAALDAKPGADMVLFDYVGYQNYRRCHHPDCERLYREHLAKNNLADTPENEKDFFLGELVAVNNAMHDAIKARNPAIITGAHLYPVFLKEPLYGNRLKFDVIGETCAWYLKWPDEKIRAYAADCTARRPAEYPRSRRVPFIAFTKRGWCEQKTAADIERELNNILDSGADEIMVFEMDAIVNDPEIYGVFLKYCGKDS